MKLLFKLLRRNISILQTLLFLAVNLLGGVIVLLGIEAYRDFASISRNDGDALSTSSIVINKSLSADATLNSIMGLHPSFSEEEIRELESLPSVASVGKFVTARFGVGAVLSIASSRMSAIVGDIPILPVSISPSHLTSVAIRLTFNNPMATSMQKCGISALV